MAPSSPTRRTGPAEQPRHLAARAPRGEASHLTATVRVPPLEDIGASRPRKQTSAFHGRKVRRTKTRLGGVNKRIRSCERDPQPSCGRAEADLGTETGATSRLTRSGGAVRRTVDTNDRHPIVHRAGGADLRRAATEPPALLEPADDQRDTACASKDCEGKSGLSTSSTSLADEEPMTVRRSSPSLVWRFGVTARGCVIWSVTTPYQVTAPTVPDRRPPLQRRKQL
jgi:hypothetical protein